MYWDKPDLGLQKCDKCSALIETDECYQHESWHKELEQVTYNQPLFLSDDTETTLRGILDESLNNRTAREQLSRDFRALSVKLENLHREHESEMAKMEAKVSGLTIDLRCALVEVRNIEGLWWGKAKVPGRVPDTAAPESKTPF